MGNCSRNDLQGYFVHEGLAVQCCKGATLVAVWITTLVVAFLTFRPAPLLLRAWCLWRLACSIKVSLIIGCWIKNRGSRCVDNGWLSKTMRRIGSSLNHQLQQAFCRWRSSSRLDVLSAKNPRNLLVSTLCRSVFSRPGGCWLESRRISNEECR